MAHSYFGSNEADKFPGCFSRAVGFSLPTSLAAACVVVATVVSLFAAPARAVDPFYENLLRDGADAFERKDYPEAELNLRLACFGLLDDLELLPEGLTRLALAQAAEKNTEAFQETFRHILEIEERFDAYSQHPPEPALRSLFDTQLVAHVSEGLLGSEPVFENVRRRKVLERLERLPKGEQLQSLEALIAESPDERLWRLRRANLALSSGSPEQAVPHLDAILALNPGDDEARCLRGQSLALNRCPEAVSDLMSCSRRAEDPRLAYDLADCLVEMGDLTQASQFLASLEGPARTDRALSKLRRRVEKDLRRQGNKNAPEVASGEPVPHSIEQYTSMSAPAEEASPPPVQVPVQAPTQVPAQAQAEVQEEAQEQAPAEAPTKVPAATAPPAPLSQAQRAKLGEARRKIADAKQASDLAPALAMAREVADARQDIPEAQHLAAEIAYRGSKWEDAATYFRRGGDPSDSRPNLLFFMAVSYYEAGDLEGARKALARALPRLQKTEFVEAYRRKIQE